MGVEILRNCYDQFWAQSQMLPCSEGLRAQKPGGAEMAASFQPRMSHHCSQGSDCADIGKHQPKTPAVCLVLLSNSGHRIGSIQGHKLILKKRHKEVI